MRVADRMRRVVQRAPPTLPVRVFRQVVRPFLGAGDPSNQWARIVQNSETERLVASLGDPARLDVLEISGTFWQARPFKSYTSLGYPDFDVCAGPIAGASFDLIIAEHVWEHLRWPYRATRHVHQMLRPGGAFLIETPFLVKIHSYPLDCSRWTETGLKHLLAEGGFDMDRMTSGSWGNRACIRTNWRRWQIYQPWRHSLRNEPDYPIVVWALAIK